MTTEQKRVVIPKVCNKYHNTARQGAVYIGRGSPYGNPFVIGKDGSREEVIRKYDEYLRGSPDLMAALPELRGKVLGCWCAPKPCHGDVLVKMANERK